MNNNSQSIINVLYVSPIGDIGGVERFIDTVVSHHNSDIVKPSILTFKEGNWLEKLTQNGISAYCIHDARLREPIRVFTELSKILQKEKTHIIHSAYSWSHALITPSALLHGCHSVWMHHGPISNSAWQGFMPLLPSSLLLTNSQFMKQKLSHTWHYPQNIDVVYYGLNADEFAPNDKKRQTFRNSFGIEEHELAIGIVGFLDTWKGQDIFLESVLQLKNSGIPIRTFIIGGPRTGLASERCLNFEQKLHQFVNINNLEDQVTFTGHIDIKNTGVLDGLDIFVHTSTEPEPFGMVLLEAMAKAKPIIASNEGGPCEIITDQYNGLLIQPRSPEILAHAIKTMCSDEQLRLRLSLEARQTVVKKFNPQITANKLENLYVQLTQKAA